MLLFILTHPYSLLSFFVSIHHMLLFINCRCGVFCRGMEVSIHHMLLFIDEVSPTNVDYWLFQYITCYSLSFIKWEDEEPWSMFQYITCYSLSSSCHNLALSPNCFNTSHVTLYRFLMHIKRLYLRCFNTSHVTLYLMQKQTHTGSLLVSIHHMLLFIVIMTLNSDSVKQFQYITCYSLSHQAPPPVLPSAVFQYITCYSLSLNDMCGLPR